MGPAPRSLQGTGQLGAQLQRQPWQLKEIRQMPRPILGQPGSWLCSPSWAPLRGKPRSTKAGLPWGGGSEGPPAAGPFLLLGPGSREGLRAALSLPSWPQGGTLSPPGPNLTFPAGNIPPPFLSAADSPRAQPRLSLGRGTRPLQPPPPIAPHPIRKLMGEWGGGRAVTCNPDSRGLLLQQHSCAPKLWVAEEGAGGGLHG